MKTTTAAYSWKLRALACAWLLATTAFASVTVNEDAATYTLANGIVTARIAKASGDLVSLRYRNQELLATILKPDGEPDLEKDPPGANPNGLNRGFTDHQYGFWSHDAMGPRGTEPAIARITIDPRSDGGERAEVSVKGIARNRKMGTGPGATATGQFAADVEIRYALGRGESGVYTYCIFEHPADYPASGIGEARFCAKLAPMFDWMSVAPHRHKAYPKELREGDKYVYTVVQWENPAFGWSSTSAQIGFFILNPSMEYMSGGPTKVEFQGHRDTNAVAAPCVLNYWRSSHYGGAEVQCGGRRALAESHRSLSPLCQFRRDTGRDVR
jgi:rhamnogalacturonan endolyase